MRIVLLRFLLVAFALLASVPAWACNVPVFRYALEKWPADPYQLAIYHDGPLSKEQQALADHLVKLVETEPAPLNLDMEREDLTRAVGDRREAILKRNGKPALPFMRLEYPSLARIKDAAWKGSFSAADLHKLLDSPVRQEISRRILAGDSAVWIFLDSDDPKQRDRDDQAAALLLKELQRLTKELKLPTLTDDPEDKIDLKGVELTLAFSMIRLKRDDPAEQLFIETLLNLEPDLRGRHEPLALPVFGRGRALLPLIGKGIVPENIEETCAYVVGPCTCKVKEQNPGVDLLFSVDWDSRIEGKAVKDLELPPLTGLTPAATTERGICCEPPSVDRTAHDESNWILYRNLAIGGFAGLAVLALIAFKVLFVPGNSSGR